MQEMLGKVCMGMLKNVGECQGIIGNVRECWVTLGNVGECQGMFWNDNVEFIFSKKRMGMEDRKVSMQGMLGKVCMGMLGNVTDCQGTFGNVRECLEMIMQKSHFQRRGQGQKIGRQECWKCWERCAWKCQGMFGNVRECWECQGMLGNDWKSWGILGNVQE